jgi:hypothetical protein
MGFDVAAKVQGEPKIVSGDELYKEMYPSIASGDPLSHTQGYRRLRSS